MRKFLNLFLVVPIAIILILLSVANRHSVTLNLDPLNAEIPAFSISLPFFAFLFSALIIGALIGSCLTWVSQGKHRKALREQSHETNRLRQKHEKANINKNNEPKEIALGLPLITKN